MLINIVIFDFQLNICLIDNDDINDFILLTHKLILLILHKWIKKTLIYQLKTQLNIEIIQLSDTVLSIPNIVIITINNGKYGDGVILIIKDALQKYQTYNTLHSMGNFTIFE